MQNAHPGGVFRSPPVPTAFGIPLAQDERVIFAHHPPAVTTGYRIFVFVIGLITIPAIIGIFFVIYAFTAASDRVWFITNMRVVNVTSKGKLKVLPLHEIVLGAQSKASGTIDLRGGGDVVTVPTHSQVNGVAMLDFVRRPTMASGMPGISVPP